MRCCAVIYALSFAIFAIVIGHDEVLAQQGPPEAYACTTLEVNGFDADNPTKRYRRQGFHNRRFLMKFDGKQAILKMQGKTKEETYNCSVPWSFKPYLHQCTENFYFLIFDARNLRFSFAQIFGYVDGSDDSMSIAYGECQKF